MQARFLAKRSRRGLLCGAAVLLVGCAPFISLSGAAEATPLDAPAVLEVEVIVELNWKINKFKMSPYDQCISAIALID